MQIGNEIHFSSVRFGVKGDNAAQVIKNISSIIANNTSLGPSETHDHMDHLFQTSMTGIGDGIALFDWVSDSITEPYLFCARLESSVGFSAIDDRGVDIILVLISPRKNGPLHLQYLARVTRMFREPRLLQKLRDISCTDGLSSVLSPENKTVFAA